MRLCIGYALAYPDRLRQQFGAIDWTDLKRLDFETPDRGAFRCLDLAFAAGRAGETAPAWLSAANEVVVAAFLAGQIRWVDIADVLADVLDLWPGMAATDVDVVMECDRVAREATRNVIDDKVTV
jgi:1-deoxy-D-xylulose-5-phosphate reductoisomerase